MNKAPHTLTHFEPLSSDVKKTQSGFSLSKLFKRSRDDSLDRRQEIQIVSTRSAAESKDPKVTESHESPSPISKQSSQHDTVTEHRTSGLAINVGQKRSMATVLRRLGTILDHTEHTLKEYNESDLKQYWMPDSSCKECYECGDKFTTFRRRHHCRVCGQIFCSRCCNQEVPGKLMGCTGDLRVCTYCCKVVLSYAQNSDSTTDLIAMQDDPDFKVESDSDSYCDFHKTPSLKGYYLDEENKAETLKQPSPSHSGHPFEITPVSDFPCLDQFAQERKALIKDSVQLKDLWCHIVNPVHGIELQSHRHRLRNYNSCIIGSEIVDWLLRHDRAASRQQAIAIGQALVDAKYLECISSQQQEFCDEYQLYRAGEATKVESPSSVGLLSDYNDVSKDDEEPTWFKDIKRYEELTDSDEHILDKLKFETASPLNAMHLSVSSADSTGSLLFLNLKTDVNDCSASVKKKESFMPSVEPNVTEKKKIHRSVTHDDFLKGALSVSDRQPVTVTSTGADYWQTGTMVSSPQDRCVFKSFSQMSNKHAMLLLRQLLIANGLSLTWCDIILSLATRIAEIVRPDIKHDFDDMDIRKYVHIKKVSGGSCNDSCIVHGVVCSKNTAHKKMQNKLMNPKIFLMKMSIDYQRVENKFSSIDPVVMQEKEFMRNCVSKLAAQGPDIIVVEKSVSRLAQQNILDAGITLVMNVKPSVMSRVARCTQADIVQSLEGQVTKPKLGFCHQFGVYPFNTTTGVKNLMYFDGCASHLACTVILRGGSCDELRRVKRVLYFMIYVEYHNRLEVCFLMDQFSLPLATLTRDSPFHSPEICDIKLDEPRNSSFICNQECEKMLQEEKLGMKHTEIENDESLFKSLSYQIELLPEVTLSSPKQSAATVSLCNNSQSSHAVNVAHKAKVAVYMSSDEESEPGESNHYPEADGSVFDHLDFSLLNKPGSSESCRTRTSTLPNGELVTELPTFTEEGESFEQYEDPLRKYLQSRDESIFKSSDESLVMKAVRHEMNQFRKALEDVVLSISPVIKYSLPYLETEMGKNCKLRRFFPPKLYMSVHFEKTKATTKQKFGSDFCEKQVTSLKAYQSNCEFGNHKITGHINDDDMQNLLAIFRACYIQNQVPCKCQVLTGSNSENLQTETTLSGEHDCLDPQNLQRITVLFGSFSYVSCTAPNYCVNPWLVSMDFYGKNDITLGSFLERYCFRSSYQCPNESCDTPMLDHIRKFVHDNGCIQIVLRKLDQAIPAAHGDSVLVWSWCRKCKLVTPVVSLSSSAWAMSFAKYLELRFHGGQYLCRALQEASCAHSLHHDFYQYFGKGDIVASFKYSPVVLREVSLPPLVINISSLSVELTNVIENVKYLTVKGYGVYGSIYDRLCTLKDAVHSTKYVDAMQEYISLHELEKGLFQQMLGMIQVKLVAPQLGGVKSKTLEAELLLWQVLDTITLLKINIANAVNSWNQRIQDFLTSKRLEEKAKSKNTKSQATVRGDDSPAFVHDGDATEDPSGAFQEPPSHPCMSEDCQATLNQLEVLSATMDTTAGDSRCSPTPSCDPGSTLSAGTGTSSDDNLVVCVEAGMSAIFRQQISPDSEFAVCKRAPKEVQSMADDDDSKNIDDNSTSALDARPQFTMSTSEKDQIDQKVSVKTIFAQLLTGPEYCPLPLAFPLDEHYLVSEQCLFPVVIYDSEPSSIIAFALSSSEYNKQLMQLQTCLAQAASGKAQRKNKDENDNTDSVNKSPMLSFFRGSVNRDVEKSPKSGPKKNRSDSHLDLDSVQYIPGAADSFIDQDQADGFQFANTKATDNAKSQGINLHIELQFSDNTARFFCRVYFAEQFRKIRKLTFPQGEERFLRSLCRCLQWKAKGGRSGSTFCKTHDDRFILKQLNRFEILSFLDFAPAYFAYMQKALAERKPTVLTKIFGVYRIGYRNIQNSTESKQDLLVMENLFYNRKITQIFDLKGSIRNRLAATTGKIEGDLVLLDENLLKISCDTPMYIRQYSKTVLGWAIYSDTQLLSQHRIMDYSLLVGMDETELVVGIIDYMRTFTWDKKMEMYVKSSGILGGQGKMPTVVSPELYRSRFLEAMDRYFQCVPDHWHGLARGGYC